LFNDLLASFIEGKQILRDEKEASRKFTYDRLDIKHIRKKNNLPQEQFAVILGISVSTLRNW
jgi:putative transcriptional regulator